MCVIIHQWKGKRNVTYKEFSNAWSANPHWFGLMTFVDGRVCVDKAMKLQDAWEIYSSYAEEVGWQENMVLHFRMATHWSINRSNTHPFHCGNGKYLVHNGVLGYTSKKPWEEDMSDTRLLAQALEKFDSNPNDNWLDNDVVTDMVHKICSWDKVVVMDTNGDVWFFGAKGLMSSDGELWASTNAPFSSYSYCSYANEGDLLDEEWFWDENGVYVSYKEYCDEIGIPYNPDDWLM